MKYSLVGLEYVDEVYTEAEEIPEIKYSYLDVIFEVENLAVKEETFIQGDGTIVCRLNCSWTVPTGKRADSFRAFYSTDNQQNWTYYETTIANAKSTYIDNVQAGQTYYVKIVVVKGVVVSTGTISNPVTIVGKDTPPSDLASLTVIQQENILKITVVVSGNDPDIWGFEIRLGTVGTVWEIATPLKQFRDYSTTIDVTQSGVQTFLAKAIDNSRNYSTNAVSYTTTVYNMSSRFNIYSETQDLTKATFTGMFWSKRGWQIDSVEKIGDFQYFAQIFETPITLRTDASVLLPVVDLGQNIIPETYIELFLTVLIDYANGEETSSEIQYQTSWDNVEWSQWSTLVNHQFFGRFLRVKILPLSVDGVTNVDLKSVSLKVDTIAITETIGYTSVSDSGSTRIYLKHKFFETPVIQLFSYDSSNRQCIHEIVGGLPIRGEDGTWYFDVRNWNGEIQVAGNVYGNAIGY
jgi:predicted ester cyclase